MKAAGHITSLNSRKLTVRKKSRTCGKVLKGLRIYLGKGFLTEEGSAAIEAAKRKPVLLRRNTSTFKMCGD